MGSERVRDGATIGPAFDSVLAAATGGAPWALEHLYRALAPAVVGYLRIQGAADPEDLGNEVFLGVLTRLGSFQGDEARFRSWVFTIAHSRMVDERRRTARRPRLAATDLDACIEWSGGDVEDDVMLVLSTERVRSLCDRLAPDQRHVLLLRLVAGLSIETIAETLDKSVGAVKALQRRGLDSLRRILLVEPVPLEPCSTVTWEKCPRPRSTTAASKPS